MSILLPNFMRPNLALAPFWLLIGGELAVEIEGRWLIYEQIEGRIVQTATLAVSCVEEDLTGATGDAVATGQSTVYVDLIGRIAETNIFGDNAITLDVSGSDQGFADIEGMVTTE